MELRRDSEGTDLVVRVIDVDTSLGDAFKTQILGIELLRSDSGNAVCNAKSSR